MPFLASVEALPFPAPVLWTTSSKFLLILSALRSSSVYLVLLLLAICGILLSASFHHSPFSLLLLQKIWAFSRSLLPFHLGRGGITRMLEDFCLCPCFRSGGSVTNGDKLGKGEESDRNPVLLVSGMGGSILHSKKKKLGFQTRVWVRILLADLEFKKKLWSIYNPETGLISHSLTYLDGKSLNIFFILLLWCTKLSVIVWRVKAIRNL